MSRPLVRPRSAVEVTSVPASKPAWNGRAHKPLFLCLTQGGNRMKMSLCTALCATALTFAAGTASADPWKDESGKGRWRGGDYGGEPERKFKYRSADGCEVERKWKKGEYEE